MQLSLSCLALLVLYSVCFTWRNLLPTSTPSLPLLPSYTSPLPSIGALPSTTLRARPTLPPRTAVSTKGRTLLDPRSFTNEDASESCAQQRDCGMVACHGQDHVGEPRCFLYERLKHERPNFSAREGLPHGPTGSYFAAWLQNATRFAPAYALETQSASQCLSKLAFSEAVRIAGVPPSRSRSCIQMDEGFYQSFGRRARRLCESSSTDATFPPQSSLACMVDFNPLHPRNAGQANLCRGQNLWLDLPLATPKRRLRYRQWSEYKGDSQSYMTYEPGFLRGSCTLRSETPDIDTDGRRGNPSWFGDFTGNYLADLMYSARWGTPKSGELDGAHVVGHEVVWVFRESYGRRLDDNLWHGILPYLNVMVSLRTFGVDHRNVQVVFLDNNKKSWHEDMWEALSGKNTACSLRECWGGALKVLFQHVTIVTSMGNSPFYAATNEILAPCMQPVPAWQALGSRILQHYGLTSALFPRPSIVDGVSSPEPDLPRGEMRSAADVPLRVLLQCRRGRVNRRFANEGEIVKMLEASCSTCTVAAIDFASLGPVHKQIAAVSRSDAMVAGHGAGGTWVLFMPRWGGFLEVFFNMKPQQNNVCGQWCTSTHMAVWVGLSTVQAWWPASTNKDNHRTPTVHIDVRSLQSVVEPFLEEVRLAKFAFLRSAGC